MDFFYKHKTVIFLLLFLLFSAFLGIILFSIFFASPKTPASNSKTPSLSGNLPNSKNGSAQIVTPKASGTLPFFSDPEPIPSVIQNNKAKGGLTKITTLNSNPGSNFTTSKNTDGVQYYDKYDGKFYQLDKDGNLKALSDKVFYNVQSVAWSNSKDKAVIEYPDGANIVYDFKKNKQVTLPKYWKDFEFSPDDKQIVAKSIGLDPENRWLIISNPDGSREKFLEPLGNNADRVYSSWSPNNQSVAMFTEGIDLDRQNLFFVGKNKENFKSTVIEGRGFEPLWSPKGDRLLYSVYSSKNDLKPSLWIVNAQGENIGSARQNLGIETWANKCSFANNRNLYCAVPQNLKKGAGLFPDLAQSTTDSIYKIDTQTGTSKLIAIPTSDYTISNILVPEDEQTLFFVDTRTNTVHKINL